MLTTRAMQYGRYSDCATSQQCCTERIRFYVLFSFLDTTVAIASHLFLNRPFVVRIHVKGLSCMGPVISPNVGAL